MAPSSLYPHSNTECVALLKALGFKKKLGTGRGKHPQKYYHPKRRNQNLDDKPFVLITHEYFDANGKRLMKKLQNWGFTKEEIEEKYKTL
ncbi:MAG TPA: hypothetical protein VLG25_02115 [Patescibacteria group bacterium]|nr:hypothetical protein [Patescibacteria group bacterium]